MSNIKIFVSQRIDKECRLINSSFYTNVRCGAVFDKNHKNDSIIGDDTGDNISLKRETYNELTVLYWAWKNQKADYIGLCHYRRFLSLAEAVDNSKATSEHNAGCIEEMYIDDELLHKYNLIDRDSLVKLLSGTDAIFMQPISLQDYHLTSNFEAMKKAPSWHNMQDVELLIDIINKKYPEMKKITYEYFYKYKYSFLYNCFIMRSDILNSFCSWLFDILFELEKMIDMSNYSQQKSRTLGTLAERMVGIWYLWMKEKNYHIKNVPLLYISKPEINNYEIFPFYKENYCLLACSSSKEYVPYLSVFLQSIKKTVSENYNYDIIVFERSISEEQKHVLVNQISAKNICIRFVNPSYYLRKYNLYYNSHYNLECYFRLVAPLVLRGYSKVLFTDVDLIFNSDPMSLYNIDLKNFHIGACKDLMWGAFLNNNKQDWLTYATRYLHLNEPYRYFNTGVMLINIDLYNRDNISYKVLKIISEHQFRILEQDALNYFFKTNIFYLDSKWNFAVSNILYDEFIHEMPATLYQQYMLDKESPNIIHFAGSIKPWKSLTTQMGHLWWQLARQTPFYEQLTYSFMEKDQENRENLARLILKKSFVLKLEFNFRKIIYKLKSKIYKGTKRCKYENQYNLIKSLLRK